MVLSLVNIGKDSDKRSSNLIQFDALWTIFFLHMHVGIPAKKPNMVLFIKKFMNKDCKSLDLF